LSQLENVLVMSMMTRGRRRGRKEGGLGKKGRGIRKSKRLKKTVLRRRLPQSSKKKRGTKGNHGKKVFDLEGDTKRERIRFPLGSRGLGPDNVLTKLLCL